MRLATIDVGTNTALLLVAEATSPADVRVLADHAEITRLGRGIGRDGRLEPAAIEQTLAALRGYGEIARAHGAEVVAVGTEALRRAPNADDFLEPARAALSAPVEVIGGEREAALAFLATARSFPREAAGTLVVVDIGGGSTEVIVATGGRVEVRTSLPLGSVRLTERHVHHDPAGDDELRAVVADVRRTLEAVALPGGAATLVGVAGTVTTIAAMAQRLGSHDPARVHGFLLTRTALREVVATLRPTTQDARERLPGLDPRRADVILAGALLLAEIADRIDADVLVSDRGIRWGLLYERLAPAVSQIASPGALLPSGGLPGNFPVS